MNSVEEAWAQIDNDLFLAALRNKVAVSVRKYDIRAIFCDELHSLQTDFVGEFCHISPPSNMPPGCWSDV